MKNGLLPSHGDYEIPMIWHGFIESDASVGRHADDKTPVGGFERCDVMIAIAGCEARRFTVDEYHRMIQVGVLDETDRVEFLEGCVAEKMPSNPPHDGSIQLAQESLASHIPTEWRIRIQSAVALSESEPEPDLTVVRGTSRTYLSRHPGPSDVGLLVEIADSSLSGDRDKASTYARADIAIYWIVNLLDRQVEVYSVPSGPTASPSYAQQKTYGLGETVPLVLAGVKVADLCVQDLLP
jgi:Uma2 family endonuclease